MIIIRVINNNFAQVKHHHKELIVQGKGICFGKKVGDKIDEKDVNKFYNLNDRDNHGSFKEMIDYIPAEYWTFTDSQTKYVEKELGLTLNESFFFALLDHIYGAVQRTRKGISQTFFPVDIRLYYENLYEVAIVIVENAQKEFNVKFDDSEVYFVATHLLDATIGTINASSIEAATSVIDCVLEQIKNCFYNEYDENSISYLRFLNHIRLFAARVVASNNGAKPVKDKKNYKGFYREMERLYEEQVQCLSHIVNELDKKFNYKVSSDEKFYLLLHIIRITTQS